MKVANISGGRTSMFMGIELQKQGFDGIYCFQNTGMETPETIEFLKSAPFPLIVLQYKSEKPFFTIETLDSMNKTGEPFKQLVRKRKAIPNKTQRFCTQEMKIKTLRRYMRSQKIKVWTNFLGIRADEKDRIEKIKAGYKKQSDKTVRVSCSFPLANMGITAKDIGDFWKKQNWNLDLPMLPSGKTICGNCVGCFHKSEAEMAISYKRYPALYAIMEEMEKEIGYTFRKNSMTEYREFFDNDKHFDFNIKNDLYCDSQNGSCGD